MVGKVLVFQVKRTVQGIWQFQCYPQVKIRFQNERGSNIHTTNPQTPNNIIKCTRALLAKHYPEPDEIHIPKLSNLGDCQALYSSSRGSIGILVNKAIVHRTRNPGYSAVYTFLRKYLYFAICDCPKYFLLAFFLRFANARNT